MKLENRLALLTGAVTAGTIAVCLVTALVLVRRSATRELDEEVIDGAKAAAVVVSELELEMRDGSAPSRIDIPEDTELMVRRLAIYSKEGRRVATRPEGEEFPEQLETLLAMPGAKLEQPFDLTLREGHMRAILVSRRRLHGMTLLHAVSRDQLDEVIEARTRLFAGLFVATLALVVLAALWLGRRLAADVNHVTAVARRVAAGELSARAGDAKLTNPETRNLARELDHMISELAAIMAAQRNFISYAAHELRSPLAALQGELQLALRRPRTEESYVETLGDALTEVAGLTQLTEDLLTLAHAQAESTVIASARVGAVVDEAERLVQGVAQIQEATVERDVSAVENAVVCGTEPDLARLLRNLLENAIKFGPVGGQVRVSGRLQSATVLLLVTDQGPGIAPADRAGLFAPFYRGNTKATARKPGTGLGLAIAREIARKCGGDITLDDSYTKGTCMVIRLPLAAGPTGGSERPSSERARASAQSVALLVALVCSVSACRAEPAKPTLALTRCHLSDTTGGERIAAECGSLTVPENRTLASGRTIELFISVLRATGSSALADPLFLLAGGPGGAISREFPKVAGVFGRFNVHRDLVLVDQRGTGRSHPLDCPKPEHGLDESESELKARLAACSESLQADLREYGTPQAVADLDAIRAALGYGRINLYGGSYGTRVALAYARAFPARLRSMILDGVVPYGLPLGPRIAQDSQRALDGVFARCSSDAACRAAFPDLSGDLNGLIERLSTPSLVGLAHPSTGESTHVTVSRRVAAGTIRMLSYASETATLLPLLIHEGARGNLGPLAAQALLAERMLELQEGMHFSVICSEDFPFFERIEPGGTYLDNLVIQEYQVACESWPRSVLPPGFTEPVRTPVPTLLLSGELDPVTPPPNAELALTTLPRARHLVLPGEAHGVLHRGCVTRIAAEFLEHLAPENLDVQCLQGHRPLPLFTSFKGPQP